LREVEARLGEPVRARHLVALREHRPALARGDDAAGLPGVGPELLGVVDRPAVELGIAVDLEPALADHLARELRELRLFDGAPARRGRSAPNPSCGITACRRPKASP